MPGGPQSRFSCFGCRHSVAPTHFSRHTARADAVVAKLTIQKLVLSHNHAKVF